MLNTMIKSTEEKIKMYEEIMNNTMKDIQDLAQRGNVLDIINSMDTKVQYLKDTQTQISSLKEQIGMLNFLKLQKEQK